MILLTCLLQGGWNTATRPRLRGNTLPRPGGFYVYYRRALCCALKQVDDSRTSESPRPCKFAYPSVTFSHVILDEPVLAPSIRHGVTIREHMK